MSSAIDYPLQERLRTLQDCYESFYNNEDALILRWVLEADEFVMFDAFFDIETSVAASFPDLFIKFEAPFANKAAYNEGLYRELAQNVKDYLASSEEGKVKVNWIPTGFDKLTKVKKDLFTKSLSDFGNGLPDLEDRVVAFLAPENISDDNAFMDWLDERINEEWPENIRFMMLDYIDQPRFETIAKAFPKKVMTATPALEMSEGMKEISAAAGKPSDPDNQFRAAFIDMTKAATKKKMKEVNRHADRAIGICVAEGWTHLHIGILIAVGSAWMNMSKPENALKEFAKAENMAVSARNQGDEVAGVLLANVLFSKGAVYIQMKDYEQAAAVYENIPEITADDHNKTMEAWRMTGFCYDQAGDAKPAFEAYNKALISAEAMESDQESARESTLPYIGEAIIRLNKPFVNQESTKKIKDRLDALMGKDWQN